MTHTLDISLLAYPTLTEAARLLGVSASTLSRRDDLVVERMGERDKRVPAGEAMRLAAVYRKRSLDEVAADLIAGARERSPQHAEHVQEEVERFFEQREPPVLSDGSFLAQAERVLPAELYEQVRRVYRASEGTRPPALVSAGRFDPDLRAREKQASRAADERDLSSGHRSAEQLRQENELFAAFAGSARVDLAASRSLG